MKKLFYLLAVLTLGVGISLAQAGGTAGTTNDPNASAQAGAQDPNAGAGAQAGAQDPNTGAGAQAGASAGTGDQANQGETLPQTASPLPLLALAGLGTVGAGLYYRFKR